jgi:hypothetical protein
VVALIILLLAASAFANGVTAKGKVKGVPVCEVRKPFLEYVEDGLALVLDIPLALLSPLCGPIISPIINKLDPVEKRSYSHYGSRR